MAIMGLDVTLVAVLALAGAACVFAAVMLYIARKEDRQS